MTACRLVGDDTALLEIALLVALILFAGAPIDIVTALLALDLPDLVATKKRIDARQADDEFVVPADYLAIVVRNGLAGLNATL